MNYENLKIPSIKNWSKDTNMRLVARLESLKERRPELFADFWMQWQDRLALRARQKMEQELRSEILQEMERDRLEAEAAEAPSTDTK